MNGRNNRNHRRLFKRNGRNNDPARQERPAPLEDGKGKSDFRQWKQGGKQSFDRNGAPVERLTWTAPKQSTKPLPVLNCIRCGLAITDTHAALSERESGGPVHFDCVMMELAEQETLGKGDTLSYLGGGRFGIVCFNDEKKEPKNFTIKKIFEWEDKENRAEWRSIIADHYSGI